MKMVLRMLGWLLGVLVALVVVAILTVLLIGRERSLELVFGPMDNRPVAFETLARKPTPNQYLMCPEGFCAAAIEATSPIFQVPVERLVAAWDAVVAGAPRTRESGRDDALNQRDYVQRSKWLRFPDTVTVRFIALDGERSTLAIYSRAHYGRRDLGVNQARVENWMQRLKERIERP